MKLLTAIALLFTVWVQAQPPTSKTQIGNETWVISSGTSSFRIITSNDSIAYWVRSKYEDSLIIRISYTQRIDRLGKYWERSFYFKNEDYKEVLAYIKAKYKRYVGL